MTTTPDPALFARVEMPDIGHWPEGAQRRDVPGWDGRPYQLLLPQSAADAGDPPPVLLVFHGGGGNAPSMAAFSSPEGRLDSPLSLHALATAKGYVVVYPNGTSNPQAPEVRTFNAGGGSGGWAEVSPYACKLGVDELSYVNAVLDDVSSVVSIDRSRIYATGMSNGAAMAHRLACELDGVAAIAAVGGGNQWVMTNPDVRPPNAVRVLQIHGTDDRAWPYNGGETWVPGIPGTFRSIPEAVTQWVHWNGCEPDPVEDWIGEDGPDDDPTRVQRQRWIGRDARTEVVFLTIHGGGHTWPSGYSLRPVEVSGPLCRRIVANRVMLDFFG